MKISLPPAMASLSILMMATAPATVLIYEPYRLGSSPTGYTAGLSLGATQNANVQPTEGSWSGAFQYPSGSNYTVSATGLSYAGLPTTGGSIISTNTGTNRRAISATNIATELYYSFLINFDDFDSAAVLLGLTDTAHTNVSGVRVEKVTSSSALLKVHSNSSYSSTSFSLSTGQTYLIVGKWTPGEVSDTTTLWVNPVAGEAEPGATLSHTAGKGAGIAVWNSFIHSTGGVSNFTYDEFRLGTTWEAVTQIPEPGTMALLVAPLLLLANRRFGKRLSNGRKSA